MDNDKNTNFEEAKSGEFANDNAPRARNRTVMLTPEVTGEVRARLQQDMTGAPAAGQSRGAFEAPSSGQAHSSYSPAGRDARAGESKAVPPKQAPKPVTGDHVIWAQEGRIVGFLVSFDSNPNGQVFELRVGRLIVTSEAPGTGSYIVINDTSVSPMHAIMRISAAGEIQVLDQLSEFGTRVKRFGSEEEEEFSGQKSTLEHGDLIKFGSRSFHVCVIAHGDQS